MALGALDGFRKASILGNVASYHPSPTQVFIDRQAALDAVSAAAARAGHAAADAAATTGFRKEPATRPADGQPTCSAGSTQAQEGKSIVHPQQQNSKKIGQFFFFLEKRTAALGRSVAVGCAWARRGNAGQRTGRIPRNRTRSADGSRRWLVSKLPRLAQKKYLHMIA